MAMKENTKAVLNYLKEHNGEKLTNTDIADALGLTARQVTGSVNSFVKKGWAQRRPGICVFILPAGGAPLS